MSITIFGTTAVLAVVSACTVRLLARVRVEHDALARSAGRLAPLRAVLDELHRATEQTEHRRTAQARGATPNP